MKGQWFVYTGVEQENMDEITIFRSSGKSWTVQIFELHSVKVPVANTLVNLSQTLKKQCDKVINARSLTPTHVKLSQYHWYNKLNKNNQTVTKYNCFTMSSLYTRTIDWVLRPQSTVDDILTSANVVPRQSADAPPSMIYSLFYDNNVNVVTLNEV